MALYLKIKTWLQCVQGFNKELNLSKSLKTNKQKKHSILSQRNKGLKSGSVCDNRKTDIIWPLTQSHAQKKQKQKILCSLDDFEKIMVGYSAKYAELQFIFHFFFWKRRLKIILPT